MHLQTASPNQQPQQQPVRRNMNQFGAQPHLEQPQTASFQQQSTPNQPVKQQSFNNTGNTAPSLQKSTERPMGARGGIQNLFRIVFRDLIFFFFFIFCVVLTGLQRRGRVDVIKSASHSGWLKKKGKLRWYERNEKKKRNS